MVRLDSLRTVAVLGDRHTGKTNLLFSLVKNYKGKREIIFYGYPKKLEYRQINSLQQLSLLTDSIVVMDELQNHIKFYNKRTSDDFLELLAIMAHNNNTLIFTTPMTQFITKAMDNFIDCFVYTRIGDLGSLKNGSKAKRILQENSFIQVNKWSLNLSIGEYLCISYEQRGVFSFANQKIGKDWGNSKMLKKS
jgi:hypothetical protein